MASPTNSFLAKHRTGDMPEPGIYEHVDFDVYKNWPCVNASLLKAASRTAAHALCYLTEPRKPSKALRFGSFAHAGRLEPLAITQRYAVMPDFANDPANVTDSGKPSTSVQTKWCKEQVGQWQLTIGNREIVTAEEFARFEAMNKILCADRHAHEMLNAWGPVEVAIVWDDPETNIRCMARADKLDKAQFRIVDYKTTGDLLKFADSIVRYGYDLQGAFYRDGAAAATGVDWTFAIVAQESAAPHCVQAAELDDDHMAAGRKLYRAAIERLAVACLTDEWPGYGDPDWRRPHWAPGQEEEESLGDWLRSA